MVLTILEGGEIVLISSGRDTGEGIYAIDTRGGVLRSSAFNNNGGNIRLEAYGNIITGDIESLIDVNGVGDAGDIIITSRGGMIDTRPG